MSTRDIPSTILRVVADSATPYDDWLRVGDQWLENSRWSEHHLLVVQAPDGTFWGVEYSLGLTEMQEHDLPWMLQEVMTAEQVYPHVVMSVEYRPYPPETRVAGG